MCDHKTEISVLCNVLDLNEILKTPMEKDIAFTKNEQTKKGKDRQIVSLYNRKYLLVSSKIG